MWACSTNVPESIVKMLLEYGSDVNACNEISETALHRAAELHKCNLLVLLLQHNADVRVRDSPTCGNNTVLDCALKHDSWPQVNCVFLLYVAGAHASNVDQCLETKSHLENIKIEFNAEGYPVDHYLDLIEEMLDDQQPVLALTGLCRRRVRSLLLCPTRGNQHNMFTAVTRLSIPTRLKNFLLYHVDLDSYQKWKDAIHKAKVCISQHWISLTMKQFVNGHHMFSFLHLRMSQFLKDVAS